MAAGRSRWVTLVTGDRVLVAERDGEQEVVTVRPGPGRSGVHFQVYSDAGETFVVPSDALALVGRVWWIGGCST